MVKCHQCKKKIKGFVIISCDCNHVFCMKHIHKHSHNCPYKLQTSNHINIQKITAHKLEKI